jgi:hypothetical protein
MENKYSGNFGGFVVSWQPLTRHYHPGRDSSGSRSTRRNLSEPVVPSHHHSRAKPALVKTRSGIHLGIAHHDKSYLNPPALPTVIPAQAGIHLDVVQYGGTYLNPSSLLTVIPAEAGIHLGILKCDGHASM